MNSNMSNSIKQIFCFIFLMLLSSNCFSVYQRISGIPLTSEYPRQVETMDNLAITLENHSFNIYDISDLYNPLMLSETPFLETLSSMSIKDSLAFISGCNYDTQTGYYFIIDFNVPKNPSIIYEYSTNTPSSHYKVNRSSIYNDHAYVDIYDPQDWDSILLIFDISIPSNSTLVSQLSHDLITKCMAIENEYCYLFGFGSGTCLVVDISENTDPQIVMAYSDIHFNSIKLINNIGYCACNMYFRIYDFSDPFNLNQIADIYTGLIYKHVDILENKAYLACGELGFQLMDITNFNEIFVISEFDTQINASQGVTQLAVHDENTVFLAEYSDDNFLIIDVSDPEPPISLLDNLDYRCYLNNVEVYENLLVLYHNSLIYFLDISDPENPEVLYTYGVGTAGCIQICAIEDHVFISLVVSDIHRLFVFDTSDLSNIHQAGSCFIEGVTAEDICAYNGYVYLANSWFVYGLSVYDYSSGYDPVLVAHYPDIGIYRIENIGTLAYVSDGYDLTLLDVSNPANYIITLAQWTLPEPMKDMIIQDDILYVLMSNNNLIQIYDISNPMSIILISEIRLLESSQIAWKMFIDNEKLYISDLSWNDLIIYDIANLYNPVFDSSVRWNLKTVDLIAKDDYLFTCNRYRGFNLFDTADFTSIDYPVLFQENDILSNFPNPFNPSTKIRFQISEVGVSQSAEIAIYNVKGQKVKLLFSDQLSAGHYTVVWNGEDESGKPVSSGIYFYKLDVNGKTEAMKKCLLLK